VESSGLDQAEPFAAGGERAMSDDSNANAPIPSGLTAAEIDLRRYEARLGVWKIVLGTFIVGLAGVLIPGAVSFYTAYFDNERKKAEFGFSQQAAHQQYIKDFFATAINQDIELRIRFADYFANLSGPPQGEMWEEYRTSLKDLRKNNREKINTLESQLVALKRKPAGQVDVAELDRVVRELAWANDEVGYKPTERSTVFFSDESSMPKKIKKVQFYDMMTNQIMMMLSNGALDASSVALNDIFNGVRDRYRTDVGVESPEFSQIMTQILDFTKSTDFKSTDRNNALLPALLSRLIGVIRTERANLVQGLTPPPEYQVQQQQQQESQPLQQQE
jgi:hypothetical protein